LDSLIKRSKNIMVVSMKGDIDLVNAEKLRLEVDKQLEKKQFHHLIINLEKVEFIDSSGLGAILGRYKKISATGGKIALINPQPQVMRILELSGFTRIMPIYQSEDQALREMA